MRRLILSMSQEKLGDAIGLTFQQVQKYEKGTNRMGSSRLQQIANVLKVPVTFFFEGAPVSTRSGSTNFPAKTGLCECKQDNVYSLCARKNHDPRVWRLSEVRTSEPNGARGLQ